MLIAIIKVNVNISWWDLIIFYVRNFICGEGLRPPNESTSALFHLERHPADVGTMTLSTFIVNYGFIMWASVQNLYFEHRFIVPQFIILFFFCCKSRALFRIKLFIYTKLIQFIFIYSITFHSRMSRNFLKTNHYWLILSRYLINIDSEWDFLVLVESKLM